MPSNYTIDDISPLIKYSGSWSAGSKTDSLSSQYSNNGTFTVSSTKGDSATFIFTGTRVWVFGAKRDNHGGYSVKLDGKSTDLNGFSSSPVFNQPLFASDTLPQQQHTVTITNTANDTRKSFLDIDFITWMTDSPLPANNFDDNSNLFAYSPADAWKTDLGKSYSNFLNNSGHLTDAKDASVTITFAGESLVLYGAVGPSQGAYSVKLDGSDAGNFNAHNPTYFSQQALFQTDSLGSGNHTLVLTNQPSGSQNNLAIDFALMASIPAASSSPTVSGSSTSAASPSSATPTDPRAQGYANLRHGLYIAAGIGSVCLLFTFAAVIYRFTYRRSLRRQAHGGTTDVAAFTEGGSVGKAISLQTVRDPHSDRRPLLLGSNLR
ncbi:hypothetical protein MIND_00096700 [Mycena indigotica]|uniref:Transmembrane protein n=1 Tax=Mycena indigotica TaxID=2126181 RepID=A0A8H6TFM7_9AGAR|nr:uncharacterized protein MIND_00096700 [Mycena indigotica]KAF7315806.1 hypothetical protein MIND_00096700 [Mycena indigotica]